MELLVDLLDELVVNLADLEGQLEILQACGAFRELLDQSNKLSRAQIDELHGQCFSNSIPPNIRLSAQPWMVSQV